MATMTPALWVTIYCLVVSLLLSFVCLITTLTMKTKGGELAEEAVGPVLVGLVSVATAIGAGGRLVYLLAGGT